MKTKTSQKSIKNVYKNVIAVGYCDAEHLLRFFDPYYYNSGVYGWNCDVYTFYPVAIVTGYRPFGNIHPAYSLIQEYDEKARGILASPEFRLHEMEEKVNALLDEFIDKCLEGVEC